MSDQSTKDMLTETMRNTEARMVAQLEMLESVYGLNGDEFIDRYREQLEDLGLSTDRDDFDEELISERVREDLDAVLNITYERGEPFCVTLSWGGPNIYLVDLDGFGGKRMAGYWGGTEVVRRGHDIDRLVDYFGEWAAELY